MADEASGAFGAPEYENLPWYLKPFSGRFYGNMASGASDYLKNQFQAGDNKDLMSGVPQATAVLKGAFAPQPAFQPRF